MSKIKLYHVDEFTGRENKNADHHFVFEFDSPEIGKGAAELAFHITNAPFDLLDEKEKEISKQYRALRVRSLSVGDFVVVEGKEIQEKFLCASCGWKTV